MSRYRSVAFWVAWVLLALSVGCSHRRVDAAPAAVAAPRNQPPGAHEGEVVVAVVERLERMAYKRWTLDGVVDFFDVVAFEVVAPERFDKLLSVRMKGHPYIGDRPLLLGDAVTFVLPEGWRSRDLALEELEGLAFRD